MQSGDILGRSDVKSGDGGVVGQKPALFGDEDTDNGGVIPIKSKSKSEKCTKPGSAESGPGSTMKSSRSIFSMSWVVSIDCVLLSQSGV